MLDTWCRLLDSSNIGQMEMPGVTSDRCVRSDRWREQHVRNSTEANGGGWMAGEMGDAHENDL